MDIFTILSVQCDNYYLSYMVESCYLPYMTCFDPLQNSSPDSRCLLFACCFLIMTAVASSTCYAIERKRIRENGLVGTVYFDEDSLQQPPILMFGGSSGGNFYDNYQNYAEDLVENGYSVLTLAYFDYRGRDGLPDKLRHIPLEYFKKAMVWMESQPYTSNNGQCAVIGYSRGAEAALLLGVHYPQIATVVAIVPSAYVGGAYDREHKVTGSAWTYNGVEIPYVDYHQAISYYSPWWKIIDDEVAVGPYAIPVEEMSAAVLLLSGEKDEIYPSTEMSKRMIQRLEKNQYAFPYQHISYDAGHNVRAQSWQALLQFLNKHYPPKH